jgi:hypothetical protein
MSLAIYVPSAVKGLNSFQIVILQEKNNFVIFLWFVFKNNGDLIGRQAMGDEVSWRWRWGHMHRSSTGHLTLKTTIYGRTIVPFDSYARVMKTNLYNVSCLNAFMQLKNNGFD